MKLHHTSFSLSLDDNSRFVVNLRAGDDSRWIWTLPTENSLFSADHAYFDSKCVLLHRSVFFHHILLQISTCQHLQPWLDLFINSFTSVFTMIRGNVFLTQFIDDTSQSAQCVQQNRINPKYYLKQTNQKEADTKAHLNAPQWKS